jgi:hypothetical protein
MCRPQEEGKGCVLSAEFCGGRLCLHRLISVDEPFVST